MVNQLSLIALGLGTIIWACAMIKFRLQIAESWSAKIAALPERQQEFMRLVYLKPKASPWQPYLSRVAIPIASTPVFAVGVIMVCGGLKVV